MNRVKLLTEQVANQIAAGEVVERPASVAKELVENALDASATRLVVEVQAGGRSLIRVADDGLGMNRDDALLCLERHATSKIRKAEDLTAIATMGFRGEALPSIASVSRMNLTTRERGSDTEGTQIQIHGGKIIDVTAVGAPHGTCVEVRQLFYNLPARRKFLRSEETEYGHIHHYLTLVALAYPEVALTFLHDGRVIWQLPGLSIEPGQQGRLQALRERLRALAGLSEQWIPVDFDTHSLSSPRSNEDQAADSSSFPDAHSAALPNLRLWGWIGKPGLSRATRQDQHVFVNRRPVENRALNFALLEGYHTALMKGRYPVCCLFLEIHPSEVDVNIHPAKREVRFHQERAVRQCATQAVRQALLDYHALSPANPSPPISHDTPKPRAGAPPIATSELQGLSTTTTAPILKSPWRESPPPVDEPARPPLWHPPSPSPVSTTVARMPSLTAARAIVPGEPPPTESLPNPASPGISISTKPEPPPAPPIHQDHPIPTKVTPSPATGAAPLLQVPLRVLGVVGKLYVAMESDRGLVLMDQHAAHERILFEKMMAEMEQGNAPSQRLLLPETVEVSVRDAQFLKSHLDVLNRLGVGLSEFGDRTFLLDALPPFVRAKDPRQFVLGLVDELKAAGQDVNSLRLGEHTVAKTVCRHAVKANDILALPELERLLEDLRRCAMPYTCPHGRPTLIEMNYKELEKKFGRVV